MRKKSELVSAIADLKEERALSLVRESLGMKADPAVLVAECQEGLRLVGERYEKEVYYLAGLVMGGEIFREVTELIKPYVADGGLGEISGKILIGTVAGDIHDLGKNIEKMMLECNRFAVFDLGVDVPPAEFLKQAREVEPDIIGLSGLITSAYDAMRETIELLREGGCRTPVIIGGSLLNDDIFKYTGADYWATDANKGLRLCKTLLENKK